MDGIEVCTRAVPRTEKVQKAPRALLIEVYTPTVTWTGAGVGGNAGEEAPLALLLLMGRRGLPPRLRLFPRHHV